MNYSARILVGCLLASVVMQPVSATASTTQAITRWCDPATVSEDPLLTAAARACRDWGTHLVGLDPEGMDIAYLWVLKTLLERYPEPSLASFVASFEPRFQDGQGAIVFPNAPRTWLPKDPGSGLDRFAYFVSATYGRPATRAVRFLDEFTRVPGDGYVLTHQFTALLRTDETGLALPRHVAERRPELLQRMRAEHDADPRARDLDFARSLYLLLYSNPDDATARRWIERMLGAWDSTNKHWTFDDVAELRFDGRVRRFSYGPDHPTVLAFGAVRQFLGRVHAADEDEVMPE